MCLWRKKQKDMQRKKNEKLKRKVLFERCNSVDYIKNSDEFLRSIGIGIYIWSEDSHSLSNYSVTMTYAAPSNKENLEKLINIYGVERLYDFFYTFCSNPRINYMPHNPYDFRKKGKSAILSNNDVHHFVYAPGRIVSKHGEVKTFQIYCQTKQVLKSAGYEEFSKSF